MTTKHTPGPWRTGRKIDKVGFTTGLFAADGREIGRIYTGNLEYVENARLIAAAPELLEIAETAIAFIAVWGERYRSDYGLEEAHPTHQALLKKAQDVVAKATGAA